MYSNYGTPVTAKMLKTLQGQDARFDVGIEGKYGKRWYATNLDVVAEKPGFALVQQRVSSGKPGRYTSVKKNYFLVLQQGDNVIAISVVATSRTPLEVAVQRAGVQC